MKEFGMVRNIHLLKRIKRIYSISDDFGSYRLLQILTKIIILFCLFSVTGCVKESLEGENGVSGKNETEVELAFCFEDPEEVLVKAADNDSQAWFNFLIYQYDNSTGNLLKGPYMIAPASCSTAQYGTLTSYTTSVTLSKKASKIVVLSIDQAPPAEYYRTETDLKRFFKGNITSSSSYFEKPGFFQTLTGYSKWDGSSNAIIVPMKRTYCKLSFSVSAALPAGHSFTLKKIEVCRVHRRMYYYCGEGNGYPESEQQAVYLTQNYNQILNSTPVEVTWYQPENKAGTGRATREQDKNEANAPNYFCTYIEVSGTYNNGTSKSEITYRIYPGENNTNDYNISRGKWYHINTLIRGMNPTDSRVFIKSSGL